MGNLSSDNQKFLELLLGPAKITAMLAPSFAIDFQEHQIVGALKELGVERVVDHSLAIATVNKMYEAKLEKDPKKLFIAANCPSTVSLVKNKFPDLEKYLMPVFSPIICMAKICKKTWPENLVVFIGPCITKKDEAKGHAEVAIALTYKEIKEILIYKNIDLSSYVDTSIGVEGFEEEVLKVFSTSGGIKKTIREGVLADGEFVIADGAGSLVKLFEKLEKGKLKNGVRLLDVLFCKGGCIGGPGVCSTDEISKRKQRLLDYLSRRTSKPLCSEADVA